MKKNFFQYLLRRKKWPFEGESFPFNPYKEAEPPGGDSKGAQPLGKTFNLDYFWGTAS
jgi:hypothetical protein